MAATYVNVTQTDVEEYLGSQGFKQIHLPRTVELVYAKRVDHRGEQLSLRVYTGIDPSGSSRDVGKDAMRVALWHRDGQGNLSKARTSKRVHRVQNWRKNLQARLDDLSAKALLELIVRAARNAEKPCEKCGGPMRIREGKTGVFLGCGNYPKCKHTRNVQAGK